MLVGNKAKTSKVVYETYADFAENTSVHGIQNTVKEWHPIVKFIWVVLTLFGLSFSIYMSLLFWKRYMDSPTLTTIETDFAPVANLPFPALTICSNSMIIESKINEFVQTLDLKEHDKEDVKNALPKLLGLLTIHRLTGSYENLIWLHELLLDNGHTSEFEIMKRISLSCDELLLRCIWDDKIVDCGSIFKENFIKAGRCCTFNSDLSEKSDVIYTNNFGPLMGLKVVTNNSNEENRYSTFHTPGITVVIHSYDDYPLPDSNHKIIASGDLMYLQLDGLQIYDGDSVKALTEEQRECVYASESKLKYFGKYSDANCYTLCYLNNIMKRCDCLPFYFSFTGLELCDLTHINCLIDFANSTFNHKDCHCPYQCEDIFYNVLTTGSKLVYNEHVIPNYLDGLNVSEISMVHVFFSKDTYTLFKRDTVTDNLSLLSSLGGTFGLLMGGSFTSGAEVLYFILVRFWINLKVINKTRKKQVVKSAFENLPRDIYLDKRTFLH